MTQIDDLIRLVNQFRDDRDWRQFHNPKDLALSVSLESAELLELFQWKNGKDVTNFLENGGLANVRNEFADIVIYLLMLADDLKIDVEAAVCEKLKLQAEKYPIEKSKGTSKKYDVIG